MQLLVLSDLHLERELRDVPLADADVIVLAGDISTGTRGVEWAQSWAGGRPVLYVAGNHEFYGQPLKGLIGDLRGAADGSNVHVLENDELILDGVRFLGCTLWSDFEFDGPENRAASMRVCERVVSDYRVIRRDGEEVPVTPEETRELHLASRAWLTERLADDHDGPTVVVTHHAPYIRWRPPQRALRLVAGAFISDLSELLDGDRTVLWIYGHTHRTADFEVAGTRVLSNPFGYVDELVEGFDPELVVDVGERTNGAGRSRAHP